MKFLNNHPGSIQAGCLATASPFLSGAQLSNPNLEVVNSDLNQRRVAAANLDDYVASFLSRGDFRGYLMCFDGHQRLGPFREIANLMDDESYWKCLADVWYGIETSFQHGGIWLGLFKSIRSRREHLMTKAERRHLANLPAEITIFRGHAKGKVRAGLSWTLSEKIGRRMAVHAVGARRAFMCGFPPGQTGVTVKARVLKQDVLAYFNQRKEQEIVVDPRQVFAIRPIMPASAVGRTG